MKRKLKKYVDTNTNMLISSNMDMKSVFHIMFRCEDSILAETTEDFRIKKYTYGEIKNRIYIAASVLYKKIGATHEYVGLESENCVEWIVAFWAVLLSGNKPYLINCRHPLVLKQKTIDSIGIKYIVSTKPGMLKASYIDVASLESSNAGFTIDDSYFENEIALSTSATSLRSIVCFYSGREICEQILNTPPVLKSCKRLAATYKGELKQLAFLPFYHVFGLFAVYFWFIFYGRTLVFLSDYAPNTILETTKKHGVTHIFAVPMLWHTIEKELKKELQKKGERTEKKFYKGLRFCTALQNAFPYIGTALSKKIMSQATNSLFGSSVKFCISGGSYLKASALETINGLGYPLHNGYGMSEIGITSVDLRKKPVFRNKGSIGKPFESVQYKTDENGVLFVKGSSVCKKMMIDGVIQNNDDWYKTGDIVKCDNDYYYLVGRESDIVIGENGENINPDECEKLFTLNDAVSFSVLGLDNDEKEEKLCMIVELKKFTDPDTINKISEEISRTNSSLPVASQIQRIYYTFDRLSAEGAIKVGRQYVKRGIKNGSIKLFDKQELSDRIAEKEAGSTIEMQVIRGIIADTLSIDINTLKNDQNIVTELGATSLQYFAILLAVGEAFSISEVDKNESYCYSVNDLYSFIERQKNL